jgi:hypothetical protein
LVIIDEFDSITFDNRYPINEVTQHSNKIKILVGFTGSQLQEYHVRVIEKVVTGQLLRMSI